MNPQEIKLAIETYFAGEAAEAYIVIAGYLLVLVCAGLLWFRFSDRFSIALSITLAILTIGMSGGFIYLLIRDSANRQNLVQLVDSHQVKPETRQALEKEKNRMQKVADGYLNLRRLFAAFALLGTLLILFTGNDISHAVAVGLLLFALSGVVIDHYSEERATIYLEKLNREIQVS